MSESNERHLQTKVDDLRKLIRRINYESNLTFRNLEQENIRLREELQQMRLAYSVLDQNCERFQRAIHYWQYMYEEDDKAGDMESDSQPSGERPSPMENENNDTVAST